MTQFGIQNQFPPPVTRKGWQKGKEKEKKNIITKAAQILIKAFQPQSCYFKEEEKENCSIEAQKVGIKTEGKQRLFVE